MLVVQGSNLACKTVGLPRKDINNQKDIETKTRENNQNKEGVFRSKLKA